MRFFMVNSGGILDLCGNDQVSVCGMIVPFTFWAPCRISHRLDVQNVIHWIESLVIFLLTSR